MKTKKMFLVILTFAINISFCPEEIISQWIQSSIYSGNVSDITSYNSIIFALSRETYISSNNGYNWSKANLPYICGITSICNNSNYIFAATTYDVNLNMLRSSNGGQNWTNITAFNMPVYSLSANDSYLFAGIEVGLRRSSNNGQNWTTTSLNTLGYSVLSIVPNGTTIYAGISGTPTSIKGVYISSNSGLNWSPTSLNNQSVNKVYLYNNKLFASADSGLYISTDNGSNWTKANTNFHSYSFCNFNSVLYAATDIMGVVKSTNDGLNWVNNGLSNKKVLSIFVNSNAMIAGTESEGVYHSTNNGLNWTQNGFGEMGIFALASNSNNIFVGTNSKGVLISTNSGQSFNYSSLDSVGVGTIVANGSNIYASVYPEQTVMFSSNNGLNWNSTTSPNGIEDLKVSGTNIIGCKAFGNSPFGVFSTSNNGQNWVQIFDLFDGGFTLATSGSTIYFGSFGQGVYKSTNFGINWIHTSFDTSVVYSLAINPPHVFAGTLLYGVFKSTNDGINWSQTSLNNKTVRGLTSIGTNVFAGTDDGIYLSTNYGTSWTLKNEGMGVQSVNSFLIANNYIYTGTGSYYNWPPLFNYHGLWRRPLSELTGIISTKEPVPSEYYLYQNYPNPFNPTTNIKYQIINYNFVTLKIYDVLGKEISTLVNEKQSPGVYEVTFDGSNLPSGVYFYKLTCQGQEDFSDIKKMLLIK